MSEVEHLTEEQKECKSTLIKPTKEICVLGVWGCSGSIGTIKKRWSVHFSRHDLTEQQATELGKILADITSKPSMEESKS